MPKFLTIVTNIDTSRGRGVFITSRTNVFSNAQLQGYVDTLPANGIVSIDILVQDDGNAEEEGWDWNVVLVPDLKRFKSLEKVMIDFTGEVMTVTGSGQLTLPNKVWMFALRNGELSSDLTFGFGDYPTFSTIWMILMRNGIPAHIAELICLFWGEYYPHPKPRSVVALQDATMHGTINWRTCEGHNQSDMSMMLWANGNGSFDIPSMEMDPHFCNIGLFEDELPRDARHEIETYLDERGRGPEMMTHHGFMSDHDPRFDLPLSVIDMTTSDLYSYLLQINSSFNDPVVELSRFFYREP